jgi:conjugal transfer pilus assembly protein TraI
MLDRLLQRWLRRGACQVSKRVPTRAAPTIAGVVPSLILPPAYPPVDPGLPGCCANDIIESQRPLLTMLKRIVSVDDPTFEKRYLEPIKALARYVHLLPASASDEFAGPGGLFRMSLEVAIYATQAADGRIFTPTDNVEARHALELRWKYAAFLAGLTCELYRPLAASVVTDARGTMWPKFLVSLDQWLAEGRIDRYFVNWQRSTRGTVSGAEGSAVIGKILPHDQLTWLDQGSPVIVRDIMAIALGQSRPGDSILGETVQRIREEVVKRDELTRRSRYGRVTMGSHLEPYVLDAIRHMLETGRWHPASRDGPIYFGTDGLYLEWPRACEAVRDHLVACAMPGIPRSPVTLAEILGRADAVLAQDSGQWMWDIVVSEPRANVTVERKTALRFRDAGAVLGAIKMRPQERPFSQALVVRVSEAAALAAPCVSTATADVYTSLPKVKTIIGGGVTPEAMPSLASSAAAPASIATAVGQPLWPVPTDEPRGPKAAERKAAAPVSLAANLPEGIRAILKASDAELIGRWLREFASHKHEHVCEHSGRQIAVSKDYIEGLDLDFSRVVELVDSYRWLGRPENAGRGARVGEIQFADARKLGFVLTAEAAKQLGFPRA